VRAISASASFHRDQALQIVDPAVIKNIDAKATITTLSRSTRSVCFTAGDSRLNIMAYPPGS
jgi:hypothetical protein